MFPTGRKLTVIFIALTALLASGCLEKKTNKRVKTNSSGLNNDGGWNNPWPTPTPTVDPTQVPPEPGQYADLGGSPSVSVDCTVVKSGGLPTYCHTTTIAVSKGCGNIGSSGSCPTPIAWTSTSWPANGNLNTDAELNIRVLPLPQPSQGTATTNGGGNCQYYNHLGGYQRLSMTVDIKTSALAPPYASFTFDKIPVGGVSYPYAFPVPPGLSTPVVVQVRDLKWDCAYPGNCGTDPVRPMEPVWHTECVSFKLQFSTDNTRSWNRPIIY